MNSETQPVRVPTPLPDQRHIRLIDFAQRRDPVQILGQTQNLGALERS